jgi:hypothetical protein
MRIHANIDIVIVLASAESQKDISPVGEGKFERSQQRNFKKSSRGYHRHG